MYGSDSLTYEETANGKSQNNNDEDDVNNPVSVQMHAKERHGGQEVSSAVTPEEVEALLGADNKTKDGEQVNNNHSNNATEVSVVAKPQSEADHSNDDEDGAYNIVPTEVLTKKLNISNLLKAETVAISVLSAAFEDESKAGKDTHFEHDKDKYEEGINTAFNLAISKFHLSCTLLVIFYVCIIAYTSLLCKYKYIKFSQKHVNLQCDLFHFAQKVQYGLLNLFYYIHCK